MTPLIRPDALASALRTPPSGGRVIPLDGRWRLAGPPAYPDYLNGHVPGALFVDLPTVLAGPPESGLGRHPLPEAGRLTTALELLGVDTDGTASPDSAAPTVVAYDDADGSVAARAWWLLRWLGWPADRVHVLDGGWAAWVAGGHPVSKDVPAARSVPPASGRPARSAPPDGGRMPVVDADAAARLGADGVLLDARAPARYRGDTEPVDPRAGHIPGARNAPFTEHLGPDGFWRPPAELARRYATLGVGVSEEVAVYCGSGVTACSVVLALEHCGLRDPRRPAALYPGSWSQWSAVPERPVSIGAEPGGDPAPTVEP